MLAVIILINLNTGTAYGYVHSISAPCVNTFSSDMEENTTEEITESSSQLNTNKKSPDTGNNSFEAIIGSGAFLSLLLFTGIYSKKYRRKE